jgi:serine/threonine-protein kinase
MTTDVGSRLGPYVLDRLIGRGGAARVYLAKDTRSGDVCALKVVSVPPEKEEAEILRVWFKRELKALTVLDHPGVLRLLDYGDTPEGEPYMVTEFLEGTDLKLAIDEHGPLEEAAAVAVFCKVLAGLAAAHALGIAHRDLKPANLFLCRDGRVVILDFGLARALSENVGSTLSRGAGTKLIGTPQFLSPEQVNGVSLSLQSDLFSLGGTFYFLVSGQYAFQGERPLEVITSIVMNRRSYLAETAPHISKPLARAIDQLFEPLPEHRPEDAVAAKAIFDGLAKSAKQPEAALQRYVKKITGQTQFFSVAGAAVTEDTTQEVITQDEKTQIATLVAKHTTPGPAQGSADHTAIATIKSQSKDDSSRAIQTKKPSPLVLVAGGVLLGLAAAAGTFVLLQRKPPPPVTRVAEPPPSPPPAEAPPTVPHELPPPSQPETVSVPAQPRVVQEPKAPDPPRAPDKNATGMVNCVLKQWAEVFVDGESKGKKQNAVSFVLSAGKHELQFQNTNFSPKKMGVVVKKNAELRVEVDFTK